MSHQCELCDSTIMDTAYVCSGCCNTIAKRVRTAADNFGEMYIALARQARFGEKVRFSRTTSPLPYSEEAAIDLETVTNTVTVWGRLICSARGIPGPGRGNNALGWLAGQLDWLRYREEAAQGFDEIDFAARLVERAIDAPAQHWFAGRCLEGACDAELYARTGTRTIRCRACGTQHDAEERKRWLLEQAEDTLGTAAEVSRLISAMRAELVSASQVRSMAHRGRISAHGTDRRGDPTYRVGDVLNVLSAKTEATVR